MKRARTVMVVAGMLALLMTAVAAQGADPETKPDNTWISVSGTVGAVSPDAFELDYGKGVITVEMDDGDRDADAYNLVEGDEVTVSGVVDDDLYEKRTIEASSVYVEKLSTTFYASARDEEDRLHYTVNYPPYTVSDTVIRGTVTSIPDSEEFIIDTGLRAIRVETDAMAYDPLDDIGYQRIDVGDVVQVIGRMDDDLFEGREFVASTIVTLSE